MSLALYLANLLIIIIGNLYGISNVFACGYQPPWDRKDSHHVLKEMYKLAEDDERNEEQDASLALMSFREIAFNNFEEWKVNSDDECDCVMLDPVTVKKEKYISNDEEKCFPQYHDKYKTYKGSLIKLQQNDPDNALKLAINLTKMYPRYSRGYALSATIELRRGNDKEALEYLNLATQVNPKNPVGFAGLAIYYYVHGDREQARKFNKEAISLQPRKEFAYSEDMDYLEGAFGVQYESVDP